MADLDRWTQESALKLRYRVEDDPKGRGNYYVWEGGTGFGMRLYRSGRRTWVCATTLTDRETGGQRSRFFTVGVVGVKTIKDARNSASEKLTAMRSGIDPRAAEKAAQRASEAGDTPVEGGGTGLADTTLRQALAHYVDNRNCAPVSKRCLASTLKANLPDWMDRKLLTITSTMLQARYRNVMDRIMAEGEARDAERAKLPENDRILLSAPGYWTGTKAALDTIKGFGRVYRYWIKKHMDQLQRGGIIVPQCPTMALMDDVLPEQQRVKGVPRDDLRRLVASFASYRGNALHPLAARLLLASGKRVGVLISAKWEYVQEDRIVIPPNAERAKIRWNKRHLNHLAQVVPITPEIKEVLDELKRVGPDYGDAKTWLFPSREAESGHVEEERAIAKGLRKHAGVRFTPHQLRHNFASIAEDIGMSKPEIAELLSQGTQTVTDRYIDERVKRHRKQLRAIAARLAQVLRAQPAQERRAA